MKHIKTFKDVAAASALGTILAVGLAGCSGGGNGGEQSIQKQNATVFIEKTAEGTYKIADEFPSNDTRVFLRETDGEGKTTERLLSQEEIDRLIAEENAKIEAGTSGLTNSTLSSGGMGLGEAILASAAGAILGSWIGSKLFGSPGYQNARQSAYKTPSAYSKSVNSFKNSASASGSSSAKKSGFFGGGSKAASGSSVGG